MKVMKIILDGDGDRSIKNETISESPYTESYDHQEPITVAALDTQNKYVNYYSYNNPPTDYNYHRKDLSYDERNGQSYRSSTPPKQKSESQFMYNKMPLPCTECKEWGHHVYHCKGAGKNGAFGKKYAPVYCTNCEEWTWHGRNNKNCPINQGN